MRGSAWVVVPVLAALAAGCSPKPKTAPAPAAVAAATPVTPAAAEATAAPGSALGPNGPEPSPAGPSAPVSAGPAPASATAVATEARVRFSPVDYGRREQRLNALIANAETRDTTGETQYRAREGRAQRARCTSRACIERSYAAEEAWLRKWEGSGDVR